MGSDNIDFEWGDEVKPASSGLPNPNPQKERPVSRQKQVQQGQRPPQRPQQGQQVKQNGGNQRPQQGQRPSQGQRPQQRPPQQAPVQQQAPAKKKSPVLAIVVTIVILLIILAVGVVFVLKRGGEQGIVANVDNITAYDNLLLSLHSHDATTIDMAVGFENGDSYLAQEYAYVNGVALREEFISRVYDIVMFSYNETGDACLVTIPDYEAFTETIHNDSNYISSMLKSSNYHEEDYTWNDEVANLYMQYFVDSSEIHTKQVEIFMFTNGGAVADDSEIDRLLFSSDEFHNSLTAFSQEIYGYTGCKTEEYYEKEEQHNPEYDEWKILFDQYFTEDNGVFRESTSKWEPWYLRDADNNYIFDENGDKVVNYYSVKDENGNDWIQPDETVMVDVLKERQVPDEWVEETGIMYNILGTYYIQNEYRGVGDTVFRVGDGSYDRPAGVGTSIITKALGDDGNYHDVRVTVVGYWTGQDAIDYVELFDSRNKGFSSNAVIQLITFEIEVENLEKEAITISSEMSLTDDVGNVASRSGTMYSFKSEATIPAGGSVLLNDWAMSTELEQKYVAWGKSFDRRYPMVCFAILAGTGEVPTYSAYEQFSGTSRLRYQD